MGAFACRFSWRRGLGKQHRPPVSGVATVIYLSGLGQWDGISFEAGIGGGDWDLGI